jgi:hypothetical protein
MTARRAAWAATAAAAVVVGACSSTEVCGPLAPSRMPDGSEPGAAAASISGGAPVAIWRSADSFVIQRIVSTTASGEPACPDGALPGPDTECLDTGDAEVRGQQAVLANFGDDPTQWFLAWSSGGCRYETAFGPLSSDEAEAYAAGY